MRVDRLVRVNNNVVCDPALSVAIDNGSPSPGEEHARLLDAFDLL